MNRFRTTPPTDTLHDDISDKLEETYDVALEMLGNVREYQEKAPALMTAIRNKIVAVAEGYKGRVSDETEQNLLEIALFIKEFARIQVEFALANGRASGKLGRTRGVDSTELDETLDKLEERHAINHRNAPPSTPTKGQGKQLSPIQPQEEIIC